MNDYIGDLNEYPYKTVLRAGKLLTLSRFIKNIC